MIFARPLKKILGKTVPFGQFETINTGNLGSGDASDGTYLRGDGTWAEVPVDESYKSDTVLSLLNEIVEQQELTIKYLRKIASYE